MASMTWGMLLFALMLLAGGARGAKAHLGAGPGDRVVSATEDVKSPGGSTLGRIRYHYRDWPMSRELCCVDVVALGVGTAMSVSDYDALSRRAAAASPGAVVVVTDYDPGGLMKTSPDGYAALFNALRERAGELIPACAGRAGNATHFYVGGHSASGQAALVAAQRDLYGRRPAGFVGLDPYDASADTLRADLPLPFPTLDWGFTRTTCLVNVEKAAVGAYRFSSADAGRVLYVVDNDRGGGDGDAGVAHCVFADDGCGVGPLVVCPTEVDRDERAALFGAIADSLRLFLEVVRERQRLSEGARDADFSKRRFSPPVASYEEAAAGNKIFLYVNDDVVEGGEEHDKSTSASQTLVSTIAR